MSPDGGVMQRLLTGVPVVLKDAQWYAKYVFPFFNTRWRVALVAFDVLGAPPKIWDRGVTFAGRELRIDTIAGELTPGASVELKRFEGLLHFDPWWAFKGAGFPVDLVRAVVPTNIAARPHLLDVPRTVADVAFDGALRSVLAVEMEDDHFSRRTFVEGTLDLARLRG